MELGNLAKARLLYIRAIELETKHVSPNYPKLAIRYSGLGRLEQELGNFTVARQLFLDAIKIGEHHFNNDHPELAVWYWNLALLEQDEGNFTEAATLVHRAYQAWHNKLGPDHRYTVDARDWLARNDPTFDPGADGDTIA